MAINKAQMKKLATPALAGAASQAAAAVSPAYGPGLGSIAVGITMKNAFAQEMGAFQLGAAAARNIPGVPALDGGLL